jgi:hypothetical protein
MKRSIWKMMMDSMIDDHPMIYLVGNKGGRDGQ